MKQHEKTSLRKRAVRSLAGIACASVFLGSTLIGCATSGKQSGLFGNYGQLKSSKEVTKEFTNYEVKGDHNYFIAGAHKDSLNAILALDNRYTLGNTRFWHPLNSQDKTLQDLIENMGDAASKSGGTPYGANVLDHNGNDIGDWYSTANTTIVKTRDGKTFNIYTPTVGGSGGGGSSGSGSGGGGGGGSGGA